MTPYALGLFAAASLFALAAAAAPRDNTPPRLDLAHDEGTANPAMPIAITVRLKMTDEAAFKTKLDALYTPGSPTFHRWMTDADLARFAPPPAQIAVVRAALERHGLTVTQGDRYGFSLRATGALGDVARAFQTEIRQFTRNGQAFRANIRNAALEGPAAAYVASVTGLESHTVRNLLTRAINAKTRQPYAAVPAAAVEAKGGLASLITDQALSPSQSFTYTTPGASLPTATYTGLVYDANPALFPDFSGHALQRAYGLQPAYKAGLDGTGQTIVLLEAYGYPTMQSDANEAAKLDHLPQLTGKNFQVVYPQGKPTDPKIGVLTGWNGEIALDIQSAHAIAPGAKILVVASNGQDSEDFQAAMQSIIDGNLGTTVSDSWEEDTDIAAGPNEQESFEDILSIAAAKGISFQFSTGDGGDGGLGTPVGAPGVPSVSPHATAVGGTAILNVPGGKGFMPVGWGDANAYIDSNGPFDPPFAFYIFGGGGGESVFWPKPGWQSALPGTGRQTPDVSALGDPYTGVPIVITVGHTKMIEIGNGGTSLSSPIFTALWALAQQKAGHALGQASPTIAGLTTGLTDVLPLTSPNNVAGTLTDSSGTTTYTAKSLFKGFIPNKQTFLAPIWDQPEYDDALAFAFGLDSSLTVTPGWDNVTGYGTPYGLDFIDAAAAYGTSSAVPSGQ